MPGQCVAPFQPVVQAVIAPDMDHLVEPADLGAKKSDQGSQGLALDRQPEFLIVPAIFPGWIV